MPADSVTPLVSSADFSATSFSDLSSNLQPGELDRIMIEATRACESLVGNRLAPFTMDETQRAEGIDPDEYGDGLASVPLDLPGSVGRSYATALGAGSLVRHMWLESYAVQYSEFWTPYVINSMSLIRSYGGSQNVAIANLIGPEADSGHVWFQLGTFLPVGSLIRVNYSGGYSTCPADLARAVKAMAASIIIKELDPDLNTAHDPNMLRDEAAQFLEPYSGRSRLRPRKGRG